MKGYDGSESFKVFNSQGQEVYPKLVQSNGIMALNFEGYNDGIYNLIFEHQGTYRLIIQQ